MIRLMWRDKIVVVYDEEEERWESPELPTVAALANLSLSDVSGYDPDPPQTIIDAAVNALGPDHTVVLSRPKTTYRPGRVY